MTTNVLHLLRDVCFQNKLSEDNRVPFYSFTIPNLGTFGLVSFQYQYWVQLSILVLLGSIVNLALAVVVYKFIVKRQGSAQSFLLGYGILCPFLLYLPFWWTRTLDLKNPAIVLFAAAGPCLLVFRVLAAMHGTSPPFAVKSLRSFCYYLIATINFAVDQKNQLVPTTTAFVLQRFKRLIRLFLETTLLFSLLLHFDYHVFPYKQKNAIWDLFYWGNLLNNFLITYLASLCLDTGSLSAGLVTSIVSGWQTAPLQQSPLTRSQSPSEFWNRRWNTLVSTALKRSIFQPLRNAGVAWPVAALVCFAGSGLFHEYLDVLMHHRSIRRPVVDYRAQICGKNFLFFVWNAIVLSIEQLVRKTAVVQILSKHLPAILQTALVLMTVLPLAHLFNDVFLDLGVYSGLALAFPRIIKITA